MLANDKLVICLHNYLFTKVILFGKNLNIWAVQKRLKETLLMSLTNI